MRIIAGEWRGRTIEAPPGSVTRPTADRVRETLFSMLVSRLGSFEGLRVADLFAGSGALGLEALSRGAAHARFVEANAMAAAAIRRNLEALSAGARAHVMIGSALLLPKAEPFDLILADPPYAGAGGPAVAQAVLAAGWLAHGGWLSIETHRYDQVESVGLIVESSREVGRARITLLRHP